jgi:hypothetical protein
MIPAESAAPGGEAFRAARGQGRSLVNHYGLAVPVEFPEGQVTAHAASII